jgi:predicted nucleic acid-binding protein
LIVPDASFLVYLLLSRPEALDALDAEAGPDEPMHAPDLIELESLSALRRLAQAGKVSDDHATAVVSYLGELRLVRYPAASLRERVWTLRHALTPYDAAYVALAEALRDGVLLTYDSGMAKQARTLLGDERVRLLSIER